MRRLEALYRSPLGRMMSVVAHAVFAPARPRMIYGFKDRTTGQFRKFTRMSSSVVVMSPEKLAIGDHVWVGHHSILDATEGITVGEGAQISFWVGVFTHGSESAIRLLGRSFVHVPHTQRQGYTRGAVAIGPYSYLGSGSMVLPGVSIGKGCLVAAMSLVIQNVPDYSIVRGQPAEVVGDTRTRDLSYFMERDYSDTYYDADALQFIKTRQSAPAQ